MSKDCQKAVFYLTFMTINDKIITHKGGMWMRSYTNLNEELDQVLTTLEKIENELENILFPIRRFIEENYTVLSGIIPSNITAISIDRIIERLIMLKNDIMIFIKNENKEKINKIINSAIIELKFISPDQEEAHKKKIELHLLKNQRKEYLVTKYEELKQVDFILENTSVVKSEEELKKILQRKENIISDLELCEDLKVVFDYENFDKTNPTKTAKKEVITINTVNDLYRLVNIIIKEKINEYMQYRYLPKSRVEELNIKLRNSINSYVEGYIITNKDLSSNIEDLKNIIKIRLKEELEDYFEIKNRLGVEYVTSQNDSILKIITVKDVVEDKYDELEYNRINKYATLLELAQVDEKNIDVVRRFVINMGPEFVPIFDKLWIQPDIKRRTKILEQRKTNNKKENI